MKKKSVRTKFIAVVLAVMMLISTATIPATASEMTRADSMAANSTTSSLPTSKYFFDSYYLDGYDCDTYVYTYSSANYNRHYAKSSIDFFWAGADGETIYATEFYYAITLRADYISYQHTDTCSGNVIVYDEHYLDEYDEYAYLNYYLPDADILRYVFGSSVANDTVIGAVKKYKDVDFALDITE